MAIKDSGIRFAGMVVYTDDTIPPDRVDLMVKLPNGDMERRALLYNLARPAPETTTRPAPLQIGEWPWDEKGNAR